MIVVSDTSPVNYLVLIEFQNLLPELFDLVLIPEAVQRELQAGGTPEPVRQFVAAAPAFSRNGTNAQRRLRCDMVGDITAFVESWTRP